MRMFGRGNVTHQRITLRDTIKEIVFFVMLYSMASVLQLAIIAVVALLLGALAGPVFLALCIALNFSPRALLDTRPFRFGVYLEDAYHQRDKPGNVRLAQAILLVAGALASVALATGYLPALWLWRLSWVEGQYVILSWLPWADWHVASTAQVVARVVGVFSIPFVGWGSVLILKWAARMEAVRPTFRESQHATISPDGVEGPMGESYASSGQNGGGERDDGPVVTVPDYS
jgi:hypothetical protein